ncbi:putative secA, preprotein cross-linking [Dioscorea sansibarensis]
MLQLFYESNIFSCRANKDAARYPVTAKVAELFLYDVELNDNSVNLTEEGVALAEMVLEANDLLDENDPWASPVSCFTGMGSLRCYGRVEEKRRWSEGIHQAVEAKEGLQIQEKEFLKMFEMPVIEVPTNLPNIRIDLPIQAIATARGKWEYVREEAEDMSPLGQPVLVGTTSVGNFEYLSELLKDRKIPHNVLDARPKYAAREAETIAQAGRKSAITISTHMAGRGTVIILGGNPKAPNVEVDGEQISQKGLSKIEIGPSSIALLAKAGCIAKYGRKSKEDWPYQKAKLLIQVSIEKGQSIDIDNLE